MARQAAPHPALRNSRSTLSPPRSTFDTLTHSPTALSLLLLVLVGAAFSPLLFSGFIDFDDDLYVTANPHVRAGLTWAGFRWAFQSTAVYNWHPVTWLAHMVNWQLYGANAWGHHLTSLILHGINTVLVFVVLKRLTAAVWPSFFVAALFGLHPLHVESVAWAAELKDVLSTLFFLLTIWSYSKYVQGRVSINRYSLINYGLAVVLYALGLMAKPMVVSLPLVILLLDFWPLQRGRVQPARNKRGDVVPAGRVPPRGGGFIGFLCHPALVDKIPFVILAAVSCGVTFVVQKHSGALTEMAHLTLSARLENALLSYCRYLGKMFWPWDLTLFYPFPDHFRSVAVVLAAVCLTSITAVAIIWRKRFPWLLTGWAWFVITLVPVIGLVQAGAQAMADRYTYIPLIGIFIVLVWAAHGLTGESDEHEGTQQTRTATAPRPKAAGTRAVVSTALIALCATLTYRQAGFWRNSETLWSHALAVTKDNFLAESDLGLELQRQKRFAEAETQFRSAVKLRPGEAKAHANLGNVLCREDRVGEGIAEFKEALRLEPNLVTARHNLGIALCRSGRFPEGVEQFEVVLKLHPDSAQTHFDLAMALLSSGRQADALPHIQRALELRPGFPEAQSLLQALRRGAPQ